MTNAIVAFVASQDAEPASPPPATDATRRVRNLVASALIKGNLIKSLEQQIDQVKAEQFRLLHEELPEAMDTAGLGKTTFQAGAIDGTGQPVTIEVSPYFKANIAADWDEERRNAGFECLIANGAEDLIKTGITISFGKKEHNQALALYDDLVKMDLSPVLKESVPWGTLTKWLQDKKIVSSEILEKIGGFIGRVVNVKIVKEEPK